MSFHVIKIYICRWEQSIFHVRSDWDHHIHSYIRNSHSKKKKKVPDDFIFV